MAFVAPPASRPFAIRVAPLVDIVFLLICFFMLATEMVRAYKDPAVVLPTIGSDAAVAEGPAEIVINLREDGTVTVAGRTVALGELGPYLTRQKRAPTQGGRPLQVVVRADRRQPFGRLDGVLQICRQAGLARVVLRALEEGAP